MSDFTTSPNMGLSIPGIGTDPGPDWANNLNASLTILDQHNHANGSGVPINPNGMNINIDLPFNGNNATSLRSARFNAQSVPLSGANDLGCIYVSGVDLYYNDENGNQVRITSGGTVNATSSGISNGTATASFVAGVLVVDSAANTPANIQAGSILFGNNTAGSNFVTVSPPNALGSSYQLVLPLLPASTQYLTLSSSGVIGTSIIPIAPTITTLTSGSGTYSTPANVTYIKIKLVAGGGGGGGGNQNGSGGSGGNTTFGTSLLTAVGGNPGSGGVIGGAGGAGGSGGSFSSPAFGFAFDGGSGSGGGESAGVGIAGGGGGNSIFGGGGGGGAGTASGTAGFDASATTGSGGGGGGVNSGGNLVTGGGGGAGESIDVIITSPGSSYSYAVGAGGAGGPSAGGGHPGGAGAGGIIIIEEHYGS